MRTILRPDPLPPPTQVLKAEPGNAEALMLRSRAYFYLNDLHMAKRHLAEVLKYNDDDAAARREFKKIKELMKLKDKVQRMWGLGYENSGIGINSMRYTGAVAFTTSTNERTFLHAALRHGYL